VPRLAIDVDQAACCAMETIVMPVSIALSPRASHACMAPSSFASLCRHPRPYHRGKVKPPEAAMKVLTFQQWEGIAWRDYRKKRDSTEVRHGTQAALASP